MRKSNFVLIYSFILALGLIGCTKGPGGSKTPGVTETEILFGEFKPMTGQESTFGQSSHKGVMMAVEEANAAGGIQNKKIRVITYDDQGKSDEAVTAATKLVTQDNVLLIIGEIASSRSIAAASVAQQYGVPMITPASTNPRVTQIGDYIFRVCFIDPFQGRVMAKFALENLKLKKAAVLRDIRSDYSVGLADVFVKEMKERGGQIVADESFSSGDMDFKAQLTSIKSKKPELVFVPGYYTEVGLIARQAKELGLSAVLLGGDGWDSDKLTEIAGNSIYGHYFSNHYSHEDQNPVVQNFVKKYKEKYGRVPDALSALGYDAARVAINAAQTAKELSPKGVRDALSATQNFQGVTGIITINESRNAVKPAVVLRVNGEKDFRFVTTVNP